MSEKHNEILDQKYHISIYLYVVDHTIENSKINMTFFYLLIFHKNTKTAPGERVDTKIYFYSSQVQLDNVLACILGEVLGFCRLFWSIVRCGTEKNIG